MTSTGRSPLPIASGDLIAGKYHVERVIGRGGMGFVVAARHRDLGHLVAIKLLLPNLAEHAGVVERFLREGRAAVQLKSEHATRVTDVGVFAPSNVSAEAPKNIPYLVMEYLEGTSLGALVRKGPLAVRDAALYMTQACEALEEAHRLGIVHRDLKPDNLFLTYRLNGSPSVKVLDFGISRVPLAAEEQRLTGAEDVMGTPQYMAPEQMESARSADARSDVWALGVTLYELLTGRPPFQGANVAETCAKVLKAQPLPPRTLRPNLSVELEDIVLQCLAKEPSRRPQTAAELAAALGPFADEGLQKARPTLPGEEPRATSALRTPVPPHAEIVDEPTTLYRLSQPPSTVQAAPLFEPGGTVPAGLPGLPHTDANWGSTMHVHRRRRVWGIAALVGAGIVSLGVALVWKVGSLGGTNETPQGQPVALSSILQSSATASASAPVGTTFAAPPGSGVATPDPPGTPSAVGTTSSSVATTTSTSKSTLPKAGTSSTSGLKKNRK